MNEIEVIARDVETGVEQTVRISNDYVITCAGRVYVAGIQSYANGTHVITVKREAS